MTTKLHSIADVKKHNKQGDLWIIISGGVNSWKVYDISKFDDHPGGDEILLQLGGQDATREFRDVGHSPEALKLLEKYHIGDLDAPPGAAAPMSSPAAAASKSEPQAASNAAAKAPPAASGSDLSLNQFLVPALIILAILAVKYLSRE